MIRTESEHLEAKLRLEAERKRVAEHRTRLRKEGLTPKQIKRALDPLKSFHLQLQEEVESYERLKHGDVGELTNLHGLGRTLVALRIACGMTQRELAKQLGVDESQVSRDERNEYHGITAERASRIFDVLGVEVRSKVRVGTPKSRGRARRELVEA